MKKLDTTNGYVVLVDDEDYEKLLGYSWRLDERSVRRRALRRQGESGQWIFLHRQIMNPEVGKMVDHINHNVLDNRRDNLRIVTSMENQQNAMKHKTKSSQYKGVYWHKRDKLWCMHIKRMEKTYYMQGFHNETEAAIAYNFWAKHLFGEYAYLNEVYCR